MLPLFPPHAFSFVRDFGDSSQGDEFFVAFFVDDNKFCFYVMYLFAVEFVLVFFDVVVEVYGIFFAPFCFGFDVVESSAELVYFLPEHVEFAVDKPGDSEDEKADEEDEVYVFDEWYFVADFPDAAPEEDDAGA